MDAILRYKIGQPIQVHQFVIERAVLNLDKIEALALIRGAYADGTYATLEEAELIYASILARNRSNRTDW